MAGRKSDFILTKLDDLFITQAQRDEATILMVESNFQRSEILPSEKAFAYKMRLEAMKRQGVREKNFRKFKITQKLDF